MQTANDGLSKKTVYPMLPVTHRYRLVFFLVEYVAHGEVIE